VRRNGDLYPERANDCRVYVQKWWIVVQIKAAVFLKPQA
jgi:hypothetical protein